jgi:hypothetical protein
VKIENMANFISIRLIRINDFHKDIHLTIPTLNINIHSDSYFLAIDRNPQNNFTGYKKVADVLINVLKWWIHKIDKLEGNKTTYLPFDFSDQYIGCLKVRMIDDDSVSIQYGFTEVIRGVDISPRDLDKFAIEDKDFEDDSSETMVNLTKFKDSIIESIDHLVNANEV